LKLKAVPEHLIILGGSYIGIEMGQIFSRLGSKVSIVEFSTHLASREDKDVSETIEEMLNEEGIDTYLNTKSQKVTHDGRGIHLHVTDTDGERMIAGSHLLVAVGRVPNTDRLNAESVGLKLDERGFISTNGKFETNVKGIWALGDINKRGAFTHTSYQDYEIALANLEGDKRSADGRVTTYAMYSDPPMGRVGMSEKEAKESGKKVLIAKHLMRDVSRAKEESETNGLIKLLVDADTEQFLGACVFGIGGDEIVQIFSNYMAAKGKYSVMKDALPIHPTVAEFIPTILAKLKPLE
jgi:pyruvate/2-oxoglutarate dehydrogenase complex dihydrolipoamide dehydrogenase (E3) component